MANDRPNTDNACQQNPLPTAPILLRRFRRLTFEQRRLLTSFLNLLDYDRERERAADEPPFDREASLANCLTAFTRVLPLTEQSALNAALSTVFLGD